MTRVNVLPVERLSDTHLLAEEREMVRVPNQLLSGRLKPKYLPTYRLGQGHVLFFSTRLAWLHRRYEEVYSECIKRGFSPQYKWPDIDAHGEWEPTEESIALNIERIKIRTLEGKRNPRYYKKEYDKQSFITLMNY